MWIFAFEKYFCLEASCLNSKMSKLPYLNIGCGFAYHKDMTNIDFVSTAPEVQAHNLLQGIPFSDNSFEAVYHSHVLEHFLRKDGEKLISECYRVLKSGGVCRIAIPDLEQIARNYIKYLEAALKNEPGAKEKYDWTMLELFDQVVRTKGGGEMVEYIKDTRKNNDDFLLERNGDEIKLLIENIRHGKENHSLLVSKPGLIRRIKGKLKDLVIKNDIPALSIGRFRLGGEIHQWMYDRYSLGELLKKYGFKDIKVMKFNESAIPNWNSFNLDSVDGKVRKPDSLFMEATK
jgi:predicted SAM-dependent methyltransferase